MSFSEQWERLYAGNRHQSVWPWTDVVALTLRHIRPMRPNLRVLELGCGAGANVPFFRSLNAEYWGIDGSSTAIGRLRKLYPDMASRFVVGDFTSEIAAPGPFDLVLDRGSLTHNQTSSLRRALGLVRASLAEQGRLLSVDMFSTSFSEYAAGEPGEDRYTRVNFTQGRLAGTGVAHFADEQHLRALLSEFVVEVLEHKMIASVEPKGGIFAAWNFIARPSGR